MIKKLYRYFLRFKSFIEIDIWRIRLTQYDKRQSFLYGTLKVILIAIKSFIADKCAIKSSALTYFSLLSIVPVLAIALAIAKGFNLEQFLKDQLGLMFSGQENIQEQTFKFAEKMISETNGGLLAGIGALILLYTVLNLLTNIESIFNDIWNIRKGRKLKRKLTDYLSIVIAGPLLIVFSSSFNVFISTQIQHYLGIVNIVDLKPLVQVLLGTIPLLLFWLLFTLMFVIMPNTNVKLGPAVKAAGVTALLYVLIQWAYFKFQFGATRYSSVYSSLAALPLFLIWLQISWMIVLFGAELSFAIQHMNTWENTSDRTKMSHNFKQKMALLLMKIIVNRFITEKRPLSGMELSEKIESPPRYVFETLRELVDTGALTEIVKRNNDELTYQPAVDVNKIDINFVLNKLSDYGLDNIHMIYSEEREEFNRILEKLDQEIAGSSANRLLRDIN